MISLSLAMFFDGKRFEIWVKKVTLVIIFQSDRLRYDTKIKDDGQTLLTGTSTN